MSASTAVHARPVIGAVASRDLAVRLDRLIGPLEPCGSPQDLPSMIGGGFSRLVVYEAGAFPREVADKWLGHFCTVPNMPPLVVCWNQGAEALRESGRLLAVTRCALANTELNLAPVILRCLARQHSGDIVAQALARVEQRWVRRGDHALVAAVAIGDATRPVTDLASVTGIGVRALSHHCRAVGLPRPVTLLGWCRALHVVAAMEWDRESLRDVAQRSGDGTTRDCADYVRYHTGRAPTAWLRAGGTEALLDAFVDRLSAPDASEVMTPTLFLVPSRRMLEAVS